MGFHRKLCFLAFIGYVFFMASGVTAVEESYHFDDAKQQQIFKELSKELRCPRCQNQNIADSNATIALDMKNKTYELLQQGKSKQQIIAFMKERYGEFVHYQPPLNPVTSVLWLLPFLFVVGGAVIVFKRRPTINADEESLTKAKQLLEQDK